MICMVEATKVTVTKLENSVGIDCEKPVDFIVRKGLLIVQFGKQVCSEVIVFDVGNFLVT